MLRPDAFLLVPLEEEGRLNVGMVPFIVPMTLMFPYCVEMRHLTDWRRSDRIYQDAALRVLHPGALIFARRAGKVRAHASRFRPIGEGA